MMARIGFLTDIATRTRSAWPALLAESCAPIRPASALQRWVDLSLTPRSFNRPRLSSKRFPMRE